MSYLLDTMYKLLPLLLLLTGCLEAEVGIDPVIIDFPDLPCENGWLYTHLGAPVVDLETGKQVTCK